MMFLFYISEYLNSGHALDLSTRAVAPNIWGWGERGGIGEADFASCGLACTCMPRELNLCKLSCSTTHASRAAGM